MLIVCCVIGMIYSGGFFEGASFVEAFSNSDASVGLMLGSVFALAFTILYYCLRKTMTFQETMDCIPEGFRAMVPAILILTFAWSLKAMTDSLPFLYSADGLAEGYFDADAYAGELVRAMERYGHLKEKQDLTDEERAERAMLRSKLDGFAQEARDRFEEIEGRRL